MTRTLKLFIGSILLIGLTSCGHQEAPSPVTAPPKKPAVTKVKPLPEVKQPKAGPKPTPKGHKVGLLLPLSGPQAALGKGLLGAAEMALFETNSTAVTLLPQDTAKGATQAAQKALDEGAELLLGPIFASEVEAIKPLANARGVNLICFSTDQSVAGNGTYILGFLPSEQIECALTYSRDRGVTKVAALTPEDQYGKLIDQTLKQLDSSGKIHLLGITHYSRGDILEGNPGNARLLEEIESYKLRGAEAIVIPEGGENLTYLARLLTPAQPLKTIGSGQWDTPETLSIKGLEGGVFASTNPQERQNFESRFQQTYGYAAPRIATLAYDATALAIALADKGYTAQNLTFTQGFSGIDGVFRLTPQGLNERALAVIEVTPTGFQTLSPAPEGF